MQAVSPSLYRQNNFVEKLVMKKWFWVIAVAFMFGYPIIKSVGRHLPNALPVYSEVPEFSFTDENNRAFGLSDLKGKVWLAHIMSLNCAGECSLSMQEMQKVQHRLRGVIDRAAIVSISTDSANDTPALLFAKARELNANPIVWRFLSAPQSDVRSLVVDGLKIPTDGKNVAQTEADAVKADRLVLVDQDGNIRGYYVIEKNEINKLMIDLGLLINRKKS